MVVIILNIIIVIWVLLFKENDLMKNYNTVISDNNGITINGEKIKTPKNMNRNIQTMLNGKIYIGGFEYINSEKRFKRTIKSTWYYFF